MANQYKSFETKRLLLKPTTVADTDFVYSIMNSPKFLQYIGDRKISSLKAAETYIKERMLPQLERLGYSNYTVITKADNSKIGFCGFYDREGVDGIDIGFAFLEEYIGKGYAFESANRLMDAAVNDFGITKLSGITNKDNVPSQKLLEKIGLKYAKNIVLPKSTDEVMLYVFER